jgi:hypothetical protein
LRKSTPNATLSIQWTITATSSVEQGGDAAIPSVRDYGDAARLHRDETHTHSGRYSRHACRLRGAKQKCSAQPEHCRI